MINLLNIAEGWGKSCGLLEVKPAVKALSIERMKVCAECPEAKKSSFLKLIKGNAHQLAAIYCNKCKCPVNEKSLVKNEKCPLKKWENINLTKELK